MTESFKNDILNTKSHVQFAFDNYNKVDTKLDTETHNFNNVMVMKPNYVNFNSNAIPTSSNNAEKIISKLFVLNPGYSKHFYSHSSLIYTINADLRLSSKYGQNDMIPCLTHQILQDELVTAYEESSKLFETLRLEKIKENEVRSNILRQKLDKNAYSKISNTINEINKTLASAKDIPMISEERLLDLFYEKKDSFIYKNDINYSNIENELKKKINIAIEKNDMNGDFFDHIKLLVEKENSMLKLNECISTTKVNLEKSKDVLFKCFPEFVYETYKPYGVIIGINTMANNEKNKSNPKGNVQMSVINAVTRGPTEMNNIFCDEFYCVGNICYILPCFHLENNLAKFVELKPIGSTNPDILYNKINENVCNYRYYDDKTKTIEEKLFLPNETKAWKIGTVKSIPIAGNDIVTTNEYIKARCMDDTISSDKRLEESQKVTSIKQITIMLHGN